MSDHDAQPGPAEAVRQDIGGWISGPSITTEQVLAGDVKTGDRLIYDGRVVQVIDISHGLYYLLGGREQGVAIGWKAGNYMQACCSVTAPI